MMASFLELSNKLSQQHLDPSTKWPTLGLSTEIRLKRLKALKTCLRRSLYSELRGPLQARPKGLRDDPPLTVWGKLQVHCAVKRLRGHNEEAERLDQALQRLAALDSCVSQDVEGVLNVLELLAGSGEAETSPALGHCEVKFRRGHPVCEKKLANTSGGLCLPSTNQETANQSKKYTQYSRETLEGLHYGPCDDDDGSLSWGVDPKVLKAKPGTALHGLFDPNMVINNRGDRGYTAPRDLFGALVRSSVDSVNVKLSLPELPQTSIPEFLGLWPPTTPSSDEGFESSPSSCASSVTSTPEKNLALPWKAAQDFVLCKHKTWDTIGQPGRKTERPYLTEAGREVFDTLYRIRCQQAGIIAKQHPPVIKVFANQRQLCRSAVSVLLGLPSEIFILDKEALTFTCNPHCRLSGTSTESFQAMNQFFADAGTDYARLAHLTQREIIDSFYRRGLILQAFLGSVRKFLGMYQSAVMGMAAEVAPDWTLLKMRVVFARLVSSLRNLASLCGCDTRRGSHPGDADDPLPTGVKLISHLYKKCLDCTSRNQYLILLSLLRDSCAPYLMFIQDWSFHGICGDLYKEFMIQVDNAHIFRRDKYYWTHGYRMRAGPEEETVPLFMGAMATDIFLCGKSINLLKLCCPEHFICNVDMATPRLTITFSSTELEECHQRTADYSKQMTILARQKTITRQQKEAEEEKAKEELAIRAHQEATRGMERIKGNIRRQLQAADAKKRKIFQELKDQMQLELLRKTTNKAAERKADRERMDALTLREESEASLEETKKRELENKAKEELIAYYEALTEDARLRERRALWRVSRRNLDQRRKMFLQDDETKLIQEMRVLSEMSQAEPSESKTVTENIVKEGKDVVGGEADLVQVGKSSEDDKFETSPEALPSTRQSIASTDERSKGRKVLDGTERKPANDKLVSVSVKQEREVDTSKITFSTNQDIEPILNLIGSPGTALMTPGGDSGTEGQLDLRDFGPKEERVTPDEERVQDTSVDDILLEIGSTLPNPSLDEGSNTDNETVRRDNFVQEMAPTGGVGTAVANKEPKTVLSPDGATESSMVREGIVGLGHMAKSDSADSGIGRSAISLPKHISDSNIKDLIFPVEPLQKGDVTQSYPDVTRAHVELMAAGADRPMLMGHASDSSIQNTIYHTAEALGASVAKETKPVMKPVDPAAVTHGPSFGHTSDSTIQGMVYDGAQSRPPIKLEEIGSAVEDSGSSMKTGGNILGNIPLSHPSDSTVQGLMYPEDIPSHPKKDGIGTAETSAQGFDREVSLEHLQPAVRGPSGHPSDSTIQGLMYNSADVGFMTGIERLRGRGGLAGHPSDSTAQLVMYGKISAHDEEIQDSSEESRDDEGIDEEMLSKWKEEMDQIVFDFSAFKNTPAQDILAATGYMPSRSEVGDYCTQKIYDSNIDALDQLALPILLERSITAPLTAQIRIVNESILDYFHVEIKIGNHFKNLRRYLFLEGGDFGQSLCDQLFDELSSAVHLHKLLSPISLNLILSRAVQASGDDDSSDINKKLSFVCSSLPDVYNPNALEVLDCLELKYTVDWPSNIVITDSCLGVYNRIFLFLLKLKRASWVLKDITHQLKRSAKVQNASSSSQFHKLRIFKHEMWHFVNVMQSYVVNQVIHVSWEEFQQNLKHNVHSFDDLRNQHAKYLDSAMHRCLLNKKAAPVMKVITDILSLVLKVRTQLVSERWREDSQGRCVHPNFRNIKNLYAAFKDYSTFLFKVVSKLVTRGYQPHLEEFLMLLNFNDYYKD